MRNWYEMVSCNDAEFEGLYNELRNSSGLYIFDYVNMPETFCGIQCKIEFRYYSENRITLTCFPVPPEYTGNNNQIREWAETGFAEFSSFNMLKEFLRSFINDESNRASRQTSTSTSHSSSRKSDEASDDRVPPQPKMQYDRESITVPKTNRNLIVVDTDKLTLNLKSEIFGQDENIEKIAHLVCNHLATKRKIRPLSIFLYGPTGTGKSAVVEALVNEINNMIDKNKHLAYRPVDCTQFQERADISRLTGSAPGYIGFDEPGVFSIVEDNPHTVFVFEEIEKAANNVTEVIMQAMETGKQETNGKTLKNGYSYYDLSNCIIFFTSNVTLEEKKNIGFAANESIRPIPSASNSSTNIARRIGNETKEAKAKLAESGKFRREVVGRMNAIFKFNPLTGDIIRDIAAKCICDVAAKSHLLYITEIDTPILQEFINETAEEVESFGVRSLRNEAEYYFNDAFREYSLTHDDYVHIRVSGNLNNIIII